MIILALHDSYPYARKALAPMRCIADRPKVSAARAGSLSYNQATLRTLSRTG